MNKDIDIVKENNAIDRVMDEMGSSIGRYTKKFDEVVKLLSYCYKLAYKDGWGDGQEFVLDSLREINKAKREINKDYGIKKN